MNGEKDFDFANFIDTNCINAIDTNSAISIKNFVEFLDK